MAEFEKCLAKVKRLSHADQARLVVELTRAVLQRQMTQVASHNAMPLPLTDEEIDAIVHESRREKLRSNDS